MKIRDKLVWAGVVLLLLSRTVLAESVNLKNENNSSSYDTKEASQLIEAFKIGLEKSKETYTKIDTVSYLTTLYYAIGNSYLYRYENDKAIEMYQKAIKMKPTDDKAYNIFGLLYSEQNKYNKAIESFAKAIEINPGSCI